MSLTNEGLGSLLLRVPLRRELNHLLRVGKMLLPGSRRPRVGRQLQRMAMPISMLDQSMPWYKSTKRNQSVFELLGMYEKGKATHSWLDRVGYTCRRCG